MNGSGPTPPAFRSTCSGTLKLRDHGSPDVFSRTPEMPVLFCPQWKNRTVSLERLLIVSVAWVSGDPSTSGDGNTNSAPMSARIGTSSTVNDCGAVLCPPNSSTSVYLPSWSGSDPNPWPPRHPRSAGPSIGQVNWSTRTVPSGRPMVNRQVPHRLCGMR